MEGGGSRNDVSFKGYQAKGDEKRQGEGPSLPLLFLSPLVIKSEKWADVVYEWPLTKKLNKIDKKKNLLLKNYAKYQIKKKLWM